MNQAVYDALKEKCGDTTVAIDGEDKKVFDIAIDLWEYNKKLKSNNDDLTAQRSTWDREKKEYKTQIEGVESLNQKIKELEGQLEETSNKGKKKDTEKEELNKELNTLKDQVKTLNDLYEQSRNDSKEKEKKIFDASKNAATENLKTDILTALNKNKIVGNQADIALNTIIAKGYAKIVEGEDGQFKRSLTVIKDGNELSPESLDTMCQDFAKDNPFLVSSSGKHGTGNEHDSNTSGSSQPWSGKETLTDLRNEFAKNL